MFIFGSCIVDVINGSVKLPDAFNLKSQVLRWYFTNGEKTTIYLKPESYVAKKEFKNIKSKQKKVLVDTKNVMYFPNDILKYIKGNTIKINGLADVLEVEMGLVDKVS